MFRTNGRPRTAVQLFCNVAWASSVGGLALLAEERRRRVAFAQKIIENGKRLQGYKAYTGVAAVAEFDLGESWDTQPPNLEREESSKTLVSKTLTNEEWRIKQRTHRPIPIVPLAQVSKDVSALSRKDQYTAARDQQTTYSSLRPNLPTHSRETIRSNQHEDTVLSNTKVQNGPVAISTSVKRADLVDQRPSQERLDEVKGSKHYHSHQRATVTRYVGDCVVSSNSRKRAAGVRELLVYRERFRLDDARETDSAIASTNIGLDAKTEASVTTQAHSIAEYSSEDQDVILNEDSFINQIRSLLSANQPDRAYAVFLTMCERLSEPLTRKACRILGELTSIYKSIGLFSVVFEINQKVIQVFKDWRLLFADMVWLMDQRLPRQNLEYGLELIRAFSANQLMPVHIAAHLFVRLAGWFVAREHLGVGVQLFISVLKAEQIDLANSEVSQMARILFENCLTAGHLDHASCLLSGVTTRGLTFSGSCTWTQKQIKLLIQQNSVNDAATLYVGSGGAWTGFADPSPFFESCALMSPLFDKIVCAKLQNRIKNLHSQKKYDEIILQTNLVGNVMKLGADIARLVYHANALVGPVLEANRVLDNLTKLDVSQRSHLVHECHGALVTRLWRQTRDLELTQKLFDRTQLVGSQHIRSVETINAIMLACVEAGLPERAQNYFDQLLHEARLAPNQDTWANLMLAKAIAKDWDALPRLFQEAQILGILPKDRRINGGFFDKVFAEFSRHHDAEQIVSFGIFITDPSRISITRFVSDCVVDAVVKAEDLTLLSKWIEHTQTRGFVVSIGRDSTSRILHCIMQSKRFRFHPILKEAQYLQVIGRSIDIPQLFARLNAIGGVQGSHRALHDQNGQLHAPNGQLQLSNDRSQISSSTVQPFNVRRLTGRRMLHALSNGNPAEALRFYHESLDHGLPKQDLDLELAVKASLMLEPDSPGLALGLIEDAKLSGLDTDRARMPLLLHSLKDKELTYDEAHRMAFNYYHKADESRVPLHHHLTLALARNLNLSGNGDGALRLLKAVNDSQWGLRKPFDLAILTMTLRLLLQQRLTDSIAWVMEAVLKLNLRIDKLFILTMVKGLREHAKDVPRSAEAKMKHERFRERLKGYIETFRERREQQRTKTLQFAKDTMDVLHEQNQARASRRQNLKPRMVRSRTR